MVKNLSKPFICPVCHWSGPWGDMVKHVAYSGDLGHVRWRTDQSLPAKIPFGFHNKYEPSLRIAVVGGFSQPKSGGVSLKDTRLTAEDIAYLESVSPIETGEDLICTLCKKKARKLISRTCPTCFENWARYAFDGKDEKIKKMRSERMNRKE